MKISLLYIILIFLVSGFWIAFSTLLAERLGSVLGGLVSNLPSNILITMIFIAKYQGIDYVNETIVSVPIGMLTNSIFLFVYILLLKKRKLIQSTLLSLILWFLLALFAVKITSDDLILNLVLYFIVTASVVWFLEKKRIVVAISKREFKFSYSQILIRAFFAGSVVVSIILLSEILPPYFVGVFSTFPAVLMTSMVILAINQGNTFAQATGKILLVSSTNIVIFTSSLLITYSIFGIYFGTLVSFIISGIWILCMHPIVIRLK